ncbi:MAG: alpha/beta hydrolase [bacterium]|nr:alpha/beta hydrolase [bacterium]
MTEHALDFSHPEKLLLFGGEVEIFDFVPATQTSGLPILYMQGYGQTPYSRRDTIGEIYRAGRRVLALSYSSTIQTVKEKGIPAILATEANIILEVLHHKKIASVDVIAHSQGCTTTILAAHKEPNRFRHFVLFGPPGFMGKRSYLEIMIRGYRYLKARPRLRATMASQEEQSRFDESIASMDAWLEQRGKVRGLYESAQPGRLDITGRLRELKHGAGGRAHGVVIFAATDDIMVPIEQLQYQDRRRTVPRSTADLGVDAFHAIEGGHEKFSTEPDIFAKAAVTELEELEQKYTSGGGQAV